MDGIILNTSTFKKTDFNKPLPMKYKILSYLFSIFAPSGNVFYYLMRGEGA